MEILQGKILFFILKPLDLLHRVYFISFFFEFEYQVFEYLKNFKFLLAKLYGFISLLEICSSKRKSLHNLDFFEHFIC